MIFSDRDVVTITPEGQHREIMLTQDGQLGYELLPGDRITVTLDPSRRVGIIALEGNDFFSLLQEKFQWGHRIAESDEE